MTDNEKLIEEARELVASWDRRGSWDADSPVGMVMRLADALEAAEKTHTPTDDEREARQALDILHRYSFGSNEIGRAQVAGLVEVVSDALRRSEVPEPSGGLAKAIADSGGIMPLVKPQGEPSDAETFEVIRKALHGKWIAMGISANLAAEDVVDALRAASAATEQGA